MSLRPTTVLSLTEPGRRLAERLLGLIPAARLIHRPKPFAEVLQTRFEAGDRLLCICASGIVIRTLAPLLRDKHRDPPVLVIDQAAQFVVPLISGHEGGGYAWGRALAAVLEARCVLTGAQHFSRQLLVVGMGCERDCPQQQLSELLQRGMDGRRPDAIASIELKSDEAGLLALARQQQLPLLFFSAAELDRYRPRLQHPSELVYRETGCYGVAEAAALAAVEQLSGAPARLLVPKLKSRRATFALGGGFLPSPD